MFTYKCPYSPWQNQGMLIAFKISDLFKQISNDCHWQWWLLIATKFLYTHRVVPRAYDSDDVSVSINFFSIFSPPIYDSDYLFFLAIFSPPTLLSTPHTISLWWWKYKWETIKVAFLSTDTDNRDTETQQTHGKKIIILLLL